MLKAQQSIYKDDIKGLKADYCSDVRTKGPSLRPALSTAAGSPLVAVLGAVGMRDCPRVNL